MQTTTRPGDIPITTQQAITENREDEEAPVNIYLVIITFMFGGVITFGNTLTLAALATTPQLQTRSNAFVASLAVADLVVGVSVVSFGLWQVPEVRNAYESAIYLCVSQLASAYTSIVVSMCGLLLISLDRWLIITQPFLYQRVVTKNLTISLIVFQWVAGISFGYVQFLILDPKDDPPVCEILSLYPLVYTSQIFPGIYYTVVIISFSLYLHIVVIARRQAKAIRRINNVHHFCNTDIHTDNTAGVSKSNIGGSIDPSDCQTSSQRSKNSQKNGVNVAKSTTTTTTKKKRPPGDNHHMKVAKMMMSVSGFFVICWTPRLTMFATQLYDPLVSQIAILLGLVNSGFNFLVYPLHSNDFRSAFKRILRTWFCSCFPESFKNASHWKGTNIIHVTQSSRVY